MASKEPVEEDQITEGESDDAITMGKLKITKAEAKVMEEIRDIQRRKRMEGLLMRKAALLKDEVTAAREAADELLGTETSCSVRERSRERSHRHRRRRHYSSSSGSRSRTPSGERRKKSKWSIKRHTTDKKEIKKLSPHELVEASGKWVLDRDDMTIEDYQSFIKHIVFLSSKAKCDKFVDSCHVQYDLAVRKRAVKEGFKAFTAGDQECSVAVYSIENLRSRAGTKHTTPYTMRRFLTILGVQ